MSFTHSPHAESSSDSPNEDKECEKDEEYVKGLDHALLSLAVLIPCHSSVLISPNWPDRTHQASPDVFLKNSCLVPA